jgi:hypothetical protein
VRRAGIRRRTQHHQIVGRRELKLIGTLKETEHLKNVAPYFGAGEDAEPPGAAQVPRRES